MTDTSSIGRRGALGLGLAPAPPRCAGDGPGAEPEGGEDRHAGAAVRPVGAQGILEQMGARMAIDDINTAGGIKALGGAKLKLIEFDTGDSAEKAKDAAQRMIAQEPDLVGGFGCWLSSFTLAATEVTERAELPWLTLSYSDADHRPRLQVRVPVLAHRRSRRPRNVLPIIVELARRRAGKRPTKVAIVGDNTAAAGQLPEADPRSRAEESRPDVGRRRDLSRRRWPTRRRSCSKLRSGEAGFRRRCSRPTSATTSCWWRSSPRFGPDARRRCRRSAAAGIGACRN